MTLCYPKGNWSVYDKIHSLQVISSLVRVYPVLPDADELINRMGFKHQLFNMDSANNIYLNTEATTGISSVIIRTNNWLVSYELTQIGRYK